MAICISDEKSFKVTRDEGHYEKDKRVSLPIYTTITYIRVSRKTKSIGYICV